MAEAAHFGNWIRIRIPVIHLIVGAVLTGLGLLLPAPWRWLSLGLAVLPLGIGAFILYLYWAFGPGGVQRRLWSLTLDGLDWNGAGEALDIGTGQGALILNLLARRPAARGVGIDLWAADWDYSRAACERNARAMGVADRVRFEPASAAELPFPDASMDAVVSHFVFHEVKDGGGPRAALAEALRVLKPGAPLAVQDMFLDRRLYGDVPALVAQLKAWGLTDVRFDRLADLIRIPRGMNGARALGRAARITGRKRADR